MRYFAIFLGLLFSIGQAQALTATGNATVVIQKFISVTEATPMHFGRVYSSASPGDVTLSAAGVRSSSVSTQFDQTATAGSFNVSGESNTPMVITFTNGTLTNGANSIVLDNLTHSPSNPTTDASGDLVISVGGKITTATNQAVGTYNGTYVITVNYQ